jgi:uncharacterized protein YwgA/O-acetyl-ADP-ribose deacetylase (regulator of RNase III)
MGKGVALEFKRRWPKNYSEYRKLCEAEELWPGKMFVFENADFFKDNEPRFLINFPTKKHWRSKSKIDYISLGLDSLVESARSFQISSIAMPPLGCGNGGLDWVNVRTLIEEKLGEIRDIDFVVFAPRESFDLPEYDKPPTSMTFARATFLKSLGDLEKYFHGDYNRLSLQKLAYFLQVLGVNLQVEFSRDLFGPYSKELRKAFLNMERLNFISGFTSPERVIHVTASAYASADEYLDGVERETAEQIISRLDKLIQGYESPYGLELLSSVYYLFETEKLQTPKAISEAMSNWSDDKRNKFDDAAVAVAYSRLKDDGLIY